ncbi:hypothetical protein PG993_012369 [Apiospora rasikravindrae]|uniref:Rhodopsin domain-containing protein n=1 Tax=Apiospora rasikravindrae TaxID=990691 RepID=A0ABR1S2D6_9PEZI
MPSSPTIGAVPPPPGVTPNFQHPPDAGRTTNLVGSIVCVTVVFFAFLLRCYAKYSIRQKYTIEDCMLTFLTFSMGCSFVFLLSFLGMAYHSTKSLPFYPSLIHHTQQPQRTFLTTTPRVLHHCLVFKHGWGFHAWDLSAYEYSQFLKWLYIQSLLYGPTVFFTKATLLFLTSRVCSVRRTISKGIHFFIYFLIICYIPLQIVKTVVCLPIEAYWDPEVRDDASRDVKCIKQGAVFLADSCVAVVTDTTIVVFPIVLVWSMHLPLYKKLRAAGILGAGGVAVAVTAYRLPLLFGFERSMDVSAGFVIIGLLCSLEQAIGFVCACLPLLNLLKSRRITPRRSRFLANVPRTFHHRVKPVDGHGLIKNPPSIIVGHSLADSAAHDEERRTAGGGTESEGISRDTRDTTYDTNWNIEANSPNEQRDS